MAPRDRLNWGKFAHTLVPTYQAMLKVPDKRMAKTAATWRKRYEDLFTQVSKLKDQTHPRVAWANRILASYRQALLSKEAAGRKELGLPSPDKQAAKAAAKPGEIGPQPADKPPMEPRDRVGWARFGNKLLPEYQALLKTPNSKVARIVDARSWRKSFNRYSAQVAKLKDQTHPRALWAKQVLAAYRKALTSKQAAGRKELGLPSLEELAAKAAADPVQPQPPEKPAMDPVDRRTWRNYLANLETWYRSLVRKDPRRVASQGALDIHLDNVDSYEKWVLSLKDQTHPRVVWAKNLISVYRKTLHAKSAEGRKLLGIVPKKIVPGPFGLPPADAPRLSRADRRIWNGSFSDLTAWWRALTEGDARRFGTKSGYSAKKDRVAVLKIQLGNMSNQAHPRVAWVKKVFKTYLETLELRAAEGRKLIAAEVAAAAKEAKEVDAELKRLDAFFDPKTFSCVLKPPYDPDKVRAWVGRLKAYKQMKTKGIASVDKFVAEHPKWAKDTRVASLRRTFGETLPYKIQMGINRTAWRYEVSSGGTTTGYMRSMLYHGERLLEYTKQGEQIKESNLASDKWVKEALEDLDESIQGAVALNVFNEEWHGRKDAKISVLEGKLRKLRGKMSGAAKRLLVDTRMPPAASSSSSLLKIARKVLEAKKHGPFKRIVISKAKEHFEERKKSEARVSGKYVKVWSWNEYWDEFKVCAAEEVDGELRLVHYTLKYIQVGPEWKTLREWYLLRRWVGRRILAENVDK